MIHNQWTGLESLTNDDLVRLADVSSDELVIELAKRLDRARNEIEYLESTKDGEDE